MLHSKNNTANTENPDETSRYEQSHLDLHCLQIRYTGKYNVQCSDKRKLAFVTASNKRANTVNPDIDIDIEDLFTVEYYKPINISSVALFLRQTYVKQQIITEHAT